MDEILTMTPDVGGVFTNLVYNGFPENIKGINLYASRNDVCIYHILTNKVDEEEYINKFSLVNQYFFYCVLSCFKKTYHTEEINWKPIVKKFRDYLK